MEELKPPDPIWANHKIDDTYMMDFVPGWKIAYYPITEDGKNGKVYDEPRALVEKRMSETYIDFRESTVKISN